MWRVLWGTDIRGLVFILIVFVSVKALISRQQGLTNRLEKKNDLVAYELSRWLEKLTWGLCHRTGSAKMPLPVPSPFPTPTTMLLYFQHWWLGKVDATSTLLPLDLQDLGPATNPFCHRENFFNLSFALVAPSPRPEAGSQQIRDNCQFTWKCSPNTSNISISWEQELQIMWLHCPT